MAYLTAVCVFVYIGSLLISLKGRINGSGKIPVWFSIAIYANKSLEFFLGEADNLMSYFRE